MKKEVVSVRKRVPHYKNLLTGSGWNSSTPTRFIDRGNYEIEVFDFAGGDTFIYYEIPVKTNTNYSVFVEHSGGLIGVTNKTADIQIAAYTSGDYINFNSGVYDVIRIFIKNTPADGTQVYKNMILVEGTFTDLEFFPIDSFNIKERLKDAGSVQEVRIRFYPGCERSLQVRPYILHKAGRAEDMFTYPVKTEGFITGDDDYLIFPVTLDFDYDDELVIEFDNVGNYIYTLAVDVIVSYYREENV